MESGETSDHRGHTISMHVHWHFAANTPWESQGLLNIEKNIGYHSYSFPNCVAHRNDRPNQQHFVYHLNDAFSLVTSMLKCCPD